MALMGSRASITWRTSQFHPLELLDPGIDMIYKVQQKGWIPVEEPE